MPNYQNAKIYKLWTPKCNEIYIGSTTKTLSTRLSQHKSQLDCESKFLFENYDDVRIELIEKFPCGNKMELIRRESEYIRTTICLNKVIPDRTQKEYQQEYREANKEKILEKQKQYREANQETLNEKAKEKVKCECGAYVSKSHLSLHKKTNKHKILTVDFRD